ncbi:MAG TPA: DNA mismatch repair endonuclease MutL [Bacteroidetes bacterium]|nr:DNA mismatch repair endonuclease MutL [Bacteroidota bacterium]
MADVIQLLPDSIANQIAAGEVVQRPASVVKELLENAVDAGATQIKLILKESGKTLVQVIDNGCGMSETDARMSFERHATSKIRSAQDLFSIRTMGFRGEAMASIAAVAQVEMRTRLHKNELGTKLLVEASKVLLQEPCQCSAGTGISVKNLFFNVPARRNFLKSNAVEMRHVLDEFQRVALANTDIFFSLHHNGSEIFHLPPGNLRQRIVGIFGNAVNQKLVPVKGEPDAMPIGGYIGKPEFARKTRGEQMFFVNQRFIKSGYLHHAVMAAYEGLLQDGTYPFYIIFFEIDPARIDINVHPTKQEIKFEDERSIYNYLRVAVRYALGRHNVTPTLDFDQETSFSANKNFGLPFSVGTQEDFEREMSQEKSAGGAGKSGGGYAGPVSSREKSNLQNWQKLFANVEEIEDENPSLSEGGESITIESKWSSEGEMDDKGGTFSKQKKEPYQIHASYIVTQIKSGFILIDQQSAHERILYERFLGAMEKREAYTQKELFPKTIDLSPADAAIMGEILPELNLLGFDIQNFGNNAFIVHGVPANLQGSTDQVKIIETLLHQYQQNIELNLGTTENIARSMARSAAIKKGQILEVKEMTELIDQLFACAIPFKSPSGRNCFLTYNLEELERMFND